jgi:putative ABC transport system ATP-binding protein
MIKVSNLRKTYNLGKKSEFTALKGVNLEISKGETVAILGKSGSGKSTLMHLMACLDRPTDGEILFDGITLHNMTAMQAAHFRNKRIGFVFQQFFLQPNLNVLENVCLPLTIRGISKSERIKKAEKALEDVEMLSKRNSRANELSGGQKQRVCIARAIVTEPEVIFADEPTGNLDSETGEKIIQLLFKLNRTKGITLILVTHDLELANLCQRKIYIKDGQIIKES